MSRHTTFRVGGPAALMALPAGEAQLAAAARAAWALNLDPVWVGNGSDLLVDDAGLDAFVIKTVPGCGAMSAQETTVTAESGALLSRVAVLAADCGLTGLEFAHGIPGSLGGGLTMNAGAYGGELCQVVTSVRALDRGGGVKELTPEGCRFAYRRSRFSQGDLVILSATLGLADGDPQAIRAKMAEFSARRREKQPLEYPSAGSFFKRPEGRFAGALIEGCGLKGLTVGGAQVSEKHAGFLINAGGATCRDILDLMEQVRDRVYRETGVTLEPEVKYLR
jgi:UDP-N-acetylmuramate dehydrogenase